MVSSTSFKVKLDLKKMENGLKLVALCDGQGNTLFSESVSDDFRRGLMAAEPICLSDGGSQVFVYIYDDIIVELKESPNLPGLNILDQDLIETNDILEKRYEWLGHEFKTLDFVDGFELGCKLMNVDPSIYLLTPAFDTFENTQILF